MTKDILIKIKCNNNNTYTVYEITIKNNLYKTDEDTIAEKSIFISKTEIEKWIDSYLSKDFKIPSGVLKDNIEYVYE